MEFEVSPTTPDTISMTVATTEFPTQNRKLIPPTSLSFHLISSVMAPRFTSCELKSALATCMAYRYTFRQRY